MCNIILQHNVFLNKMAIGHIVNIQDKDVDKVNIFDTTNKSVVHNAQKEVENLLEKY